MMHIVTATVYLAVCLQYLQTDQHFIFSLDVFYFMREGKANKRHYGQK